MGRTSSGLRPSSRSVGRGRGSRARSRHCRAQWRRWLRPASPSCSAPAAPSATPSTPGCSPRCTRSSAGTPAAPTCSSARRPDRSSPRCCGPACRRPTWLAGRPASHCRPRAPPSIATAKLGLPRRPAPRGRPGLGQMASPARLARAMRAPWEVRPGSLAAAVLPEGRIPTAHIAAPLDALYGDTWPARPMWVVAVELDSGRRVVFGRRRRARRPPPAEAVRASCAIPAYFEPAEIDGSRYVDGGVHSTTNADLVAAEQPDLVLVSAPMSAVRGVRRFGPGHRHAPDRPALAGPGGRRAARDAASPSWRSSRRPPTSR